MTVNKGETEDFYTRTQQLLGCEGVEKLKNAKVAVFGIGGVGSYAVEALARAGVGEFCLVDSDKVSDSNLNRQIIALKSTVGMYKVDVAKARILDINPMAKVDTRAVFYGSDTAESICLSEYDYVLDCIDSMQSKILLVKKANDAKVPIISSMGTGNKLDPSRFRITDISKTHTDPLARILRRELKHLGINKLTVVFSDEPPISHVCAENNGDNGKKRTPASVSFVPSAAGLIMAGEVIRYIAGQ